MTRDDYFRYGTWAALGAAGLTFIGAWIYCIATYGFLIGVSLGWIPSAICAAISAAIFYYGWGLIAGAAVIATVMHLATTKVAEPPNADALAAVATDAAATDAAATATDAAATAADAAADAAATATAMLPTSPAPTRSTYAATYGSAGCTSDCSGHDAGYEWAENNSITDPDDCGGSSQSFIEGCEAHAEEAQAEDSSQ